jgi:hypothetical protein
MRKVIVPAGGKATRFGGLLKELLPINSTMTPLKAAVCGAISGMRADDVIVISNPDKIIEHARHLLGFQITYKLQQGNELWGAITTGLDTSSDGGLILADTFTKINPINHTAPLTFGVFKTMQPERFSVIRGKQLITKQPALNAGQSDAWGCVMWTSDVAKFWKSQEFAHYDAAFQAAMDKFGFDTFTLPYYYDFGTFDAYADFIARQYYDD